MFEKIKKYFLKSLPAIVTTMIVLVSATAYAQTNNLDNSANLSEYSQNMIDRIKNAIFPANSINNRDSEISALIETLLYTSRSGNQSTNIDKEIKKYKDRAPDVFEIEDSVIKEVEPEALLRTLIQLNKLFDKYKTFTKKLIEIRKSSIHFNKFTIDLYNFSNEKYVAGAYTDSSGISLSRKYYKKNSTTSIINLKNDGYHSPYDDNKFLEQTISHEFGHVMEYLYINYYWTPYFLECLFKPYSDPNEHTEIIKNKIIKIANKNNKTKNISEDLGTYANTNAREFFAEAFATLETSTDTKYQYIRDAVKNVISDWF